MSLLPILDEIDHVQRLLEDEFPSAGSVILTGPVM